MGAEALGEAGYVFGREEDGGQGWIGGGELGEVGGVDGGEDVDHYWSADFVTASGPLGLLSGGRCEACGFVLGLRGLGGLWELERGLLLGSYVRNRGFRRCRRFRRVYIFGARPLRRCIVCTRLRGRRSGRGESAYGVSVITMIALSDGDTYNKSTSLLLP